MFTILSPSKKIDFSPVPEVVDASQPALIKDAAILMRTLRGLSRTRIRELMGISQGLAQENYEHFRSFDLPFTAENAKPAALVFAGDVYRGLDAGSLGTGDLTWAQDRIGILSGLYGLLRPLDLIQPYRLEMKTRLKTRRGENLYTFWGDRIAKRIRETVANHGESTVVDLASAEYCKAVGPRNLGLDIVTPVFYEIKDGGEGKVIGFLAKFARGLMARYIIENRIEDPEDLKNFDRGGYAFREEESSDLRWVFSRPFVSASKI